MTTDVHEDSSARAGPTRWAGRALRGALLVVLVLLCLLLVVTVGYPRVRGYVPLTILTGSMEPTYAPGTQVFVDPFEGAEQAQTEVGVGSVITFMPYPDDPTLVTHRVVEVAHGTDGHPVYTTQGDANDTPDEEPVEITQVRGVVRYDVPWVGHAASSMDGERKGDLAKLLAGGLFAYAAWNIVVAARERRGGREGQRRAE